MRDSSLSDFDIMWERLINWGRAGRQDTCRPDPESVTAGIYDMGRADRQGEGESGEEAEPDAAPINGRDADNLDGYIRQLRGDHRFSVCEYFYRRKFVYRPKLDEAVRALCDLEEANQRTNRRMRG